MSTVNFNKNNINDILKKARQIDAEIARNNHKANAPQKHLKRLEDVGILDAIDYAPKRAWGDLFTHTPSFKYINDSFIASKGLNDEFAHLKDVQYNKQWAKSIRNVTGTLALGAGLAAATLTPLGQVAGLGYLASWAMPTAVTAGLSGLTSIGAEIANSHNLTEEGGFNKQEEDAFNEFTTALRTRVGDNVTDMHKYWNAADKLAKIKMTEAEALKALSSLYTEGNNKLRERHNVSLVDVYLNDQQKRDLKGYNQIDADTAFVAAPLNKDMTTLPDSIQGGFYTTKGHDFTDQEHDLNSVIGFKLHALENIGVTVDRSKLKLENNSTVTNINEAINKHYGSALDDALLIYQGKNSMAAPIIEKVEKVLQNALEIFSNHVIKLAKAKNLKNVPQITGELVEKTLSAIMIHTSIPANDTKLTKILNAIANNTALKVAANLNNYASDTKKAEANKALYAAASLDDLYENDGMRINKLIKSFSKRDNGALADMAEKRIERALKNKDYNSLKRHARDLSTETGKKFFVNSIKTPWIGEHKILKRRYNSIPRILPSLGLGKNLDLVKYGDDIAKVLNKNK